MITVRATRRTRRGWLLSDLLADDPFYVAHRCGGGNWPEFSMHGAQQSALRYKALELSVWRCSTGEWVCSHDYNTVRMTGVAHGIGTTPWSTLSTLTQTAANTSDPSQPGRPLARLSDMVEAFGATHVLFIDDKATSSDGGNTSAQVNRDELLDYIMSAVPSAEQRVVWKVFKAGYTSADAALARGLSTWGIYYGSEITTEPVRDSSFTLLGMNWNAAGSSWSAALGKGKPVLGHVITTASEYSTAVSNGADGFMCSIPLTIP